MRGKKPKQQIQRHGGTFPTSVPWDRSWQFPRSQKQMRCALLFTKSTRNYLPSAIWLATNSSASLRPLNLTMRKSIRIISVLDFNLGTSGLLLSYSLTTLRASAFRYFRRCQHRSHILCSFTSSNATQTPTPDARRNVEDEILGCKTTNCPPALDLPTIEKLAT